MIEPLLMKGIEGRKALEDYPVFLDSSEEGDSENSLAEGEIYFWSDDGCEICLVYKPGEREKVGVDIEVESLDHVLDSLFIVLEGCIIPFVVDLHNDVGLPFYEE